MIDHPLQVLELGLSKTPEQLHPWELYTRRNRGAFLLVLCLIGASNSLDRNIISVLLEQIKVEFHVSDTMLGLLSGMSFALFYATFGIPIARWADRGDRTLVITLSLGVWSVMTALCGFASTFWQLTIARFGVGAGEAGSIPSAQSLIADYYPPQKRAGVIGIFTSSQSIGFAIGLALGGFIAQKYGWRVAFILVGVVGVVLAPLIRFVLKEPRRNPQFAVRPESGESTLSAVRKLLDKPAYRNILGGIVIYYVMAYGVLAFIVSLIIRVHELNVAEAGAAFGAVTTTGAAIGGIVGGVLADRLAARDIAWLASVAAWGMLVAIPFYELALFVPSTLTMLSLLLIGTTLISAVVPAMFSALHVVCGSKRRALSIAAAFFLVNLIGIGLGPALSGALSDRLGATYGTGEGLRYALMTLTTVLVPSSYLMLRAARYLKSDAED